jgi:biotin transport system substrate-specific component
LPYFSYVIISIFIHTKRNINHHDCLYPIASYLKGNKNSFKNFFLAGLAVIPITYIFGVAMLCFIMKLSILEGITIGALPFIPGDIIKTLIASYVAVRLRKNLFY